MTISKEVLDSTSSPTITITTDSTANTTGDWINPSTTTVPMPELGPYISPPITITDYDDFLKKAEDLGKKSGVDADEEEVSLKDGKISKEIDPTIFLDKQNKFRTKSLFRETKVEGYRTFFTLRDYDYDGHLSFKRKYLEIADPTEYQVGIQLLGSYKHWLRLLEAPWFKNHRDEWKEEVRVKIESENIERLQEWAKKKNSTGYGAVKTLIERYGKVLVRGRPSRTEIDQKLHEALSDKKLVDLDAERLQIRG